MDALMKELFQQNVSRRTDGLDNESCKCIAYHTNIMLDNEAYDVVQRFDLYGSLRFFLACCLLLVALT